jgi:dinuclear metal center YbgI/SA1388 family protein
MPTLKEIIPVIEGLAPPGLAADWDNSGLQVGDPGAEVKKVLVALDPVPAVIKEAAAMKAGLVVAHHPLFFGKVRGLDLSHGTGAVVKAAVDAGIALYSAHTSFDSAPSGVSDALARQLGLTKARPLQPAPGWPSGCGIGRVGGLPGRRNVRDVALKLKAALGLERVRLVGDPEKPVKRAALCGGSGADFIEAAHGAGADLYVTGDVKYHDALKALELGMAVLDIGHFASESPSVPHLARLLTAAFRKKGWKIKVEVSRAQSEPWSYL